MCGHGNSTDSETNGAYPPDGSSGRHPQAGPTPRVADGDSWPGRPCLTHAPGYLDPTRARQTIEVGRAPSTTVPANVRGPYAGPVRVTGSTGDSAASRTHRDVEPNPAPGRVMLHRMVSQPTHCHVWSTDGRYQGTRRLTAQDRRMLTAQGWKMTLVQRPVPTPRSQPQPVTTPGPVSDTCRPGAVSSSRPTRSATTPLSSGLTAARCDHLGGADHPARASAADRVAARLGRARSPGGDDPLQTRPDRPGRWQPMSGTVVRCCRGAACGARGRRRGDGGGRRTMAGGAGAAGAAGCVDGRRSTGSRRRTWPRSSRCWAGC